MPLRITTPRVLAAVLALCGLVVVGAQLSSGAAASAATTTVTIHEHSYTPAAGGQVVAYWDPATISKTNVGKQTWVMFVHGGYWNSGTPTGTPDADFCELQVEQGRTCFSVGYRLVPKVIWPKPLHDVESDLAWIRAHGSIFDLDAKAGIVVGVSSGALMSSIAALHDGKLAGIVSLSGATDAWYDSKYDPNETLRAAAIALMGTTDTKSPNVIGSRVVAHISTGTTRVPFLLIHYISDPTVSAQTSTNLAYTLSADGFPVSYDRLPGDVHDTDADPTALSDMNAWIDGRLAVVLRDGKPPSP